MATKQQFYAQVDAFYNKLKLKFDKFLDTTDTTLEYKYVFSKHSPNVSIYLGDKLKLKAEYSIIGTYNIGTSIWYWAWNMAFINHSLTTDVIKLKTYNIQDLKLQSKEHEKVDYLLTNGYFYISSKNIAKLIKIVTYILKPLWILPIKTKSANDNDQNVIKYIMINKILEIKN